MKVPLLARCLACVLGLGLAAGQLRADDLDPNVPLTPQQVDQLLGPIALYPDALVALILPASTTPGDITLAARYLASGGDTDHIDDQAWNESVKALARYPQLIKWMDDNLAWTRELGVAFMNQPDDVMNSVQRLRARARASGALTSTAQQKVLLDGDDIEIVPAQPDVIYVPYYDPNVVYDGAPGYYGPYLTFGLGLPVGFWLDYDFNWHSRVLLVGDRHHNWKEHHDWNHKTWPWSKPDSDHWHQWKAPPTRPVSPRPDGHRGPPDIMRPQPYPGGPSYPPRDNHLREGERPHPDDNHGRDGDHNRPPPANVPPPKPEPRDRHDDHDRRDDHDRQPPARPVPPRPEANAPAAYVPPANPHPAPVPEHQAPPPAVRPDRQAGPPVDRQPPLRPEVRPEMRPANPPPVRQAPPPPPPPTRDGTRDKEPEVAH